MQGANCPYCQYHIPFGATVCGHCGAYMKAMQGTPQLEPISNRIFSAGALCLLLWIVWWFLGLFIDWFAGSVPLWLYLLPIWKGMTQKTDGVLRHWARD